MAGKKAFRKMDCSQAYHCLQLASHRSTAMIAFNSASRTIAYRGLVQRLSRSLSAFSSFFRQYFDPVIQVDHCAQYFDDIVIAANNPQQLLRNLSAVFGCIQKAGLKLTKGKCHIGEQQIDFLRTDEPLYHRELPHKKSKFQIFYRKSSSLDPKNFERLHWISKLTQKLHTWISCKIKPIFSIIENN